MIGLSRLTCAIADVPTGGMQTGNPKVVLKLADAWRIKAELEGVIGERDALAKEVDDCNEKIGSLTDERDQWYSRSVLLRRCLAQAIKAFYDYEMDVDDLPPGKHKEMIKALESGLDASGERCMREVQAAAVELAAEYLSGHQSTSKTDNELLIQFAADLRKGGE